MRLLAVFAFLVVPMLVAASPASALTAEEQAWVAKAEAYLNGIGSLRAHFLQVASDGSAAQGTLYIERPGRLRLEYAPPMRVYVVADGTWLTYVDEELGQVSQVPLDETPARVLVEADVRFAGDIEVVGVERRRGLVRITLVRADAPDQGSLTLVFEENPFTLRQWVVVDPQGLETRVTLTAIERDVALDPALFKAPPPTPNPAEGR